MTNALTELEARVLETVRNEPRTTTRELAIRFGVRESVIAQALVRVIELVGDPRGEELRATMRRVSASRSMVSPAASDAAPAASTRPTVSTRKRLRVKRALSR